ncbi:MAG: UDP-2,3-diacylglucosamine diphosphatase [Pseudomonadota bacterium]
MSSVELGSTNHHASPNLHGSSAFISDLHLGTAGCRAERILDFLEHLNVEQLYLVGDIIDLERMQQSVHWPESHTRVLQRLFQMTALGTEVIYIPGNHDARIRAFAGTTFKGIKIRMNAIHTTQSGKRLLVTHGDQFDSELKIGSLKEKIGSAAYQWLVSFDVGVNRVRARFGYEDVSIASAMKLRIKSAQQYIARYEALALSHAKRRGLDGIVCGHIHKPAIIESDDVVYYNDGDWVEHCSVLVEATDGTLANYQWSSHSQVTESAKQVA